MNDKVRLYAQVGQLLVDAKRDGTDPLALIDAALSWDVFVASVVEAQQLSQPEDFDFLHRLTDAYPSLRRYTPAFLDVLDLRASPAAVGLLDAVNVLRGLNATNGRAVPAGSPSGFVTKRWGRQ